MLVAVKCLHVVTDESVRRFKAEIVMLSQLRHPHIVELLGCMWGGEGLAMVTELVTNGNASDALRNPSLKLSWSDPKLRMMVDAAQGMEYLHKKTYFDDLRKERVSCVIHRDLKPANMLITPTFSLKLADFGEARAKDMSNTMTMVGTPLYLAPEVVRGDRYDEKVGLDWHS